MKILAIETSCDETAIAVIEARATKSGADFSIISDQVSSQVSIHRPFGGVVPNLAKREHIRNLPILFKRTLKAAKIPPEDLSSISAIAVTSGPGLEPALWTGINFAQELSAKYKLPIVAVNHLEGHIYSAFMRGNEFSIPKNIFPLLTLIVSGGHTEIVLTKKHLMHKILGETLDDAAGEAFDKVARMLKLPYPGGPEISKLAKAGNPKAIPFPRPMINSKDLNFSFSGLKTAVLYYLRDAMADKNSKKSERFPERVRASEPPKRGLSASETESASKEFLAADIAASFEQTAVDVLVKKTFSAVEKYKPKTIALGGGVAANEKLRETLSLKIPGILLPEKNFTGDNAAMIAVAAYFKAETKKFTKESDIKANGRLSLT